MSGYADTLDAIYSSAADPANWSQTLERVADFTGAFGALLLHNKLRARKGSLITARLREDLNELYLRQHTNNPGAKMTLGVRTGRVYVASALMPPAMLRRDPVYPDILAPQKIEEQVMLPLDTFNRGGEETGGVGLTLTRRQADNAEAVAARLTRLAPHLSRAVSLSALVARRGSEQGSLGSLLDAMPQAAMVLGPQGGLLRANARAEQLLSARDGLTVGPRPALQLKAHLPHADRRLQSMLRRAMSSLQAAEHELEQAIQIARPSGCAPYLAIVTPLPVSLQWRAFVEPETRVLLQVVDPAAPAQARLSLLRSGFGLTAAEAKVARLVASGLSAPQVATALGISSNTVRTHLSRCFDKTGARSQVTLSRLLAALAPRSRD